MAPQTEAAIVLLLAVVAVGAAAAIAGRAARRRGLFVPMGPRVVVRCRAGHLFTTVWMPLASFKALRLGFTRFQYCPVGRHWTLVVPVPDRDLTDVERQEAELHHDTWIP